MNELTDIQSKISEAEKKGEKKEVERLLKEYQKLISQ